MYKFITTMVSVLYQMQIEKELVSMQNQYNIATQFYKMLQKEFNDSNTWGSDNN